MSDPVHVTVAVALSAAALFAVGSALQHRAAGAAPASSKLRMLVSLVRRPSWLLGQLLSAGAFALHATALHLGNLVLVQPVILSGIVFTVIVRSALAHRLPGRSDVFWSVVTWAGLCLIVVTFHPSFARSPASLPAIVMTSGGLVAALILVVLATTLVRGRRRALLLGAAAGTLFGTVAGLVKVTLSGGLTLHNALFHWSLWALLGLGAWAVLLNQRAYQSARVTITVPVLNLCQLVVGLAFGWIVFSERPDESATRLALQLGGLVMISVGVIRLSTAAGAAQDPLARSPAQEVS